MIVIYHRNDKVLKTTISEDFTNMRVVECIVALAQKYPDEILAWCHADFSENLNISVIEGYFHHKKMLLSYHLSEGNYLDRIIGYADESMFIKVNKQQQFATWQTSSDAGALNAAVVLACTNEIDIKDEFGYFLNSFAKRAMAEGLFCYSDPRLFRDITAIPKREKLATATVFRFIKQHYKTRWVFLLVLNLLIYERRFPLFSMLRSLFYPKRTFKDQSLDTVEVFSTKKVIENGTIDVIIPTIGRKQHLHNVLKDLAKQTYLPVNVIIVEQNPAENSVSELDFVANESWPFCINHIFTHQSGACNARNLCLSHTKSEFVFLADDDNRFDSDLIEKVFENFTKYGNEVLQTAYPQPGEKIKEKTVVQYGFFGAGNAFLKRSCLQYAAFDMAFEFGYGEDNDFGMQLRYSGYDVLYLPKVEILHLKAPMGGFRIKPVFRWSGEKIQPKPSPTIMLYQLRYCTKEQLRGYKTNLFVKFYSRQHIKNPLIYFRTFKKQWNQSLFWANALVKNKS